MKKKHKPLPKITLVVTVRGHEPLAQSTIECARDTAGEDIEVICVFDGQAAAPWADGLVDQVVEIEKPVRCQRARHIGIEHATRAVVVVCDAHMRFSDGWAREVAAFFTDGRNRDTVGCCKIGCLSPTGTPLDDGRVYTGAKFWERVCYPSGDRQAMAGRWHKQEPGEIGCIMGAFYAFRRKWYESVGAPWKYGRGWGMDEEILSAGAWLTGGRVVLLPDSVRAWHRFRERPPYQPEPDEVALVYIERLKILHVLPMPSADRSRLLTYVSGAPFLFVRKDVVERARLAAEKMRDFSERLAANRWAEFAERWVEPFEHDGRPFYLNAKNATPTNDSNSQSRPMIPIIRRPRERCPSCDAIDSFRVRRTAGERRYVVCERCGLHAVRLPAD